MWSSVTGLHAAHGPVSFLGLCPGPSWALQGLCGFTGRFKCSVLPGAGSSWTLEAGGCGFWQLCNSQSRCAFPLLNGPELPLPLPLEIAEIGEIVFPGDLGNYGASGLWSQSF